MVNELLIGLFAILGGSLRYGLSQWWAIDAFPLATLLINLIGSFALSFLNQTLAHSKVLPTQLTLGIGTGFIGAFTTFSTFMSDAVKLMMNAQYFLAGLYLVVSILFGFATAWVGYRAGRYCWANVLLRQRVQRHAAATDLITTKDKTHQ